MTASLKPARWRLLPVESFGKLAGTWDELNDGFYRSPLLTSRFVAIALEHFGTATNHLAVADSSGSVVAMAILTRSSGFSWQTFQPAQAPLGAWLQRSDVDTGQSALSLLGALPRSAIVLGVTQQDPDLLPRPAQLAQPKVHTQDYIRTARVSIRGTFDEYWQQRGQNLRQNLRRQRNKLAREQIATRLEVVSDPAAIGAAVDDYGNMESRGWKGKEGTALHPSNAQGRFYRVLLTTYARDGEAAVYRYFFNERLVATDLCISRGRTLALLKTTHEELDSKVSPTMLMRQDMFNVLFTEARFSAIEFYGKLMEWHTRWSTEIRTMYHVNVYRWAWLKRVRARRDMALANRALASRNQHEAASG